VLGILSIITKLDLNILLTLNFNKGDLLMIGAVITWGIYSAFLKKRKFEVSLLTFVHILCTFGLLALIPQFLYEFMQGQTVTVNSTFIYSILYLAVFPSIGSYYCWAGAVSIIGANRAGIFLSLIPLFSAIMAILFFHEKFQFYHFIGSILTLFGLFLSNKKIN
jgi:drug/metabolite transporter (DMT)-like permease